MHNPMDIFDMFFGGGGGGRRRGEKRSKDMVHPLRVLFLCLPVCLHNYVIEITRLYD